jgi:hypothetical protein
VPNDRKLFFYFSNASNISLTPCTKSLFRRHPTQNGMMILPPLALPYGGQITYVNPTKIDRVMKEKSRSSSTSKHRSSSRQNHEQIQTATATA